MILSTSNYGGLEYPSFENSGYQDVLNGGYQIAFNKFSVVEAPDGKRLRLANTPHFTGPLDGPIKRCPAHRIKDPQNSKVALNDILWNLLIDAYKTSGRLN